MQSVINGGYVVTHNVWPWFTIGNYAIQGPRCIHSKIWARALWFLKAIMDATSHFPIYICLYMYICLYVCIQTSFCPPLMIQGPSWESPSTLVQYTLECKALQPTFVTCMSKWSPIVHELHNSIMDFLTHMEPHQEVHVTFLGFTKLTLI